MRKNNKKKQCHQQLTKRLPLPSAYTILNKQYIFSDEDLQQTKVFPMCSQKDSFWFAINPANEENWLIEHSKQL